MLVWGNLQRLRKDVTEVLHHDFTSPSAVVKIASCQENNIAAGLNLSLCLLEGPYRGGHFEYFLQIPDNYPFHPIHIWCRVPTWHPNIDLKTGHVSLPLNWSPVLSLVSVVISVQVRFPCPPRTNWLTDCCR